MIQLFQNGGPSQVDLFDPKPELNKRNGQASVQKVEAFTPFSEWWRGNLDPSRVSELTHPPCDPRYWYVSTRPVLAEMVPQ